jgi:hypothetical protein
MSKLVIERPYKKVVNTIKYKEDEPEIERTEEDINHGIDIVEDGPSVHDSVEEVV